MVGDDSYANQPTIQHVLDGEMDNVFPAKEDSQPDLYEEIASLEKLGEVHTLQRSHWKGKNARGGTIAGPKVCG